MSSNIHPMVDANKSRYFLKGGGGVRRLEKTKINKEFYKSNNSDLKC